MRDLFLFGHWDRNSIQFSILKILFGASVFEICFQVLFKLSSLLGWPKSLSPISKGKNSNVQKNNLQICSFVLIMLYFTLSFNFTLPTRVILFFLWLLVSQKKYGESVLTSFSLWKHFRRWQLPNPKLWIVPIGKRRGKICKENRTVSSNHTCTLWQ